MIEDSEIMMEIEGRISQVNNEEGDYVGIVTVIDSEIIRPGTRSEMAVMRIKVNNSIYGSIGETTSITIYTKNNQVPLLVDNKYLVVLKDVELFRPHYWLEAHQVVDCQNCIDIVRQCENVINRSNRLNIT
jgi:hypothetical protein